MRLVRYGGVGDRLHTFTPLYIHTSGAKSKLHHAIGQCTPERPREAAADPPTAAHCPRGVHSTSRHSRGLGARA